MSTLFLLTYKSAKKSFQSHFFFDIEAIEHVEFFFFTEIKNIMQRQNAVSVRKKIRMH